MSEQTESMVHGHYHDPRDMMYARALGAGAPKTFEALRAWDDAALRAEGAAIPRKYKELMAVAVALTTQCVYCIEGHTKAARREGATSEELAETVFVAAALRAGGAVAHGLMAMKFFEQESG